MLDATKKFKLVTDAGAGLSIFKPGTYKNYTVRSKENLKL